MVRVLMVVAVIKVSKVVECAKDVEMIPALGVVFGWKS